MRIFIPGTPIELNRVFHPITAIIPQRRARRARQLPRPVSGPDGSIRALDVRLPDHSPPFFHVALADQQSGPSRDPTAFHSLVYGFPPCPPAGGGEPAAPRG